MFIRSGKGCDGQSVHVEALFKIEPEQFWFRNDSGSNCVEEIWSVDNYKVHDQLLAEPAGFKPRSPG
jgi:hypothetical protein